MKATLFLAVAQASQPSYEEWAAQYGASNDEGTKAKYYQNVALIEEWNADPIGTATFAVNEFSGMTYDEFAAVYLTAKADDPASDLPNFGELGETADVMNLKSTCCWSNWGDGSTCKEYPQSSGGGRCNTDWSKACNGDSDCPAQPPAPTPPPTPVPTPPPQPTPTPSPTPGSVVDWDVTPVKNQGGCGSCWAFSTMAVIEHVHKLNTAETVDLAEQQLVDCSGGSCAGGLPSSAMNYLKGGDIYTTSSYPYTGRDGNCWAQGPASGVKIGGVTNVGTSDSALATALLSSAVSVTLFADSKFQSYSNGILTGVRTDCSINHAVLATGYGSNFWKIKNSWGTGWGEKGFVRFERTTAGCGPFGLFRLAPVVPTEVTSVKDVQV